MCTSSIFPFGEDLVHVISIRGFATHADNIHSIFPFAIATPSNPAAVHRRRRQPSSDAPTAVAVPARYVGSGTYPGDAYAMADRSVRR